MQAILVATVVLLSVYVVNDAMSQQDAAPPATETRKVSLDSLAEDIELLKRWVGEPKSKRDNLYDMIVREFDDIEKRLDKIEREQRNMSQQVDRIQARR
jgi:hypothetical protein